MKSLWEHIILEAESGEKTYPTYTVQPKSIWVGIKYATIDGAKEAKERCSSDPEGLLKDLRVTAGASAKANDTTSVIQDLYKVYEQACSKSALSDVVLGTEIVQNSSGIRKGIKVRFQPMWKTHYLKNNEPSPRKSMQVCCFWMKSIAVAAFRANLVKAQRDIIDDRTEAGQTEGNLRVEVIENDDAILIYLHRRVEHWDI